MSIYAMLISNYFSYLIYCVKTFVFLIIIIRKVVVIRFSHRTQYLITTSVDITFINLTTEYYEQKQLLSKSMSHSNLPRDFFFFFFGKKMFSPILVDMEGCCNKVFSSQAMSHCYKLRYLAFGASQFSPDIHLLFR